MAYAMFSIGILGFIVWSYDVASLYSDLENLIYFTIRLNSFIIIIWMETCRIISFSQFADYVFLFYNYVNKHCVSKTMCKTSFNLFAFRSYYENLFNRSDHLSDNWLTWFIGFSEGDGSLITFDEGKRVHFVLTQKDSAILYEIQRLFGFGDTYSCVE